MNKFNQKALDQVTDKVFKFGNSSSSKLTKKNKQKHKKKKFNKGKNI